jgi:hypothetical protein
MFLGGRKKKRRRKRSFISHISILEKFQLNIINLMVDHGSSSDILTILKNGKAPIYVLIFSMGKLSINFQLNGNNLTTTVDSGRVFMVFTIWKRVFIIKFLILYSKISLKFRLKVRISCFRSVFMIILMEIFGPKMHGFSKDYPFYDGKLLHNQQNQAYDHMLLLIWLEKVKNLVLVILKGNFFYIEVLVLSSEQLIIVVPGINEPISAGILSLLNEIFSSWENWQLNIILFISTEKAEFYRIFDLSYSFERYLKEHTIIKCYQSFFDRLVLSSKSLNQRMQAQDNNFL